MRRPVQGGGCGPSVGQNTSEASDQRRTLSTRRTAVLDTGQQLLEAPLCGSTCGKPAPAEVGGVIGLYMMLGPVIVLD